MEDMNNNYRICTRCVSDTTMHDIEFDENGVCNFCKMHDEFERSHPLNDEGKKILDTIIQKIKSKGKNKKYDCIVGVSGGRDSIYTLLTAVKYGLRPLVVHFDGGWNSDIAVQNIKNACDILKVDLHTIVANWEEFKDLQRSFLVASVSDADAPQDYAIYSTLFHVANKEGIKYILNGHSFRTEGSVPNSWTYMDGRYLRSVQKKFGKLRSRSFPIMSMPQFVYYSVFKKIREIRILEYVNYVKKDVDPILNKEVKWQYYGGHHHESYFTHFFQSYYLPVKFNIDKRKVELSAMVRSGHTTRGEALKELKEAYPFKEFTREEFDAIMNAPIKKHTDYKTYYKIIRLLKIPIKIAASMKLVPKILYEKYAK
jgi:N-acetyl sugar amidotransferase